MTKIKVTYHDGTLWFTAKGHANYNPDGPDIVCAGISAICCAMGSALEKLGPVEFKQGKGDLELVCWPDGPMAWGVIHGALTGLREMEKKYGDSLSVDVEMEKRKMIESR